MNNYNLPQIGEPRDTVILANGLFPSHPISLSILDESRYLVCCDGAINSLCHTSKIPDAIVGDCDSLSDVNRERYATIIHRVAEQDTNDLTKAVQFCIKQGRKTISIVGATGKREDHTIGNISLLCEYMLDADVEMITDYGIFVGINSPTTFESYAGQQISLFCIDSSLISSQNLLYPINNAQFTNWWQATLNEATDQQFTIDTSGRTIVYRAF